MFTDSGTGVALNNQALHFAVIQSDGDLGVFQTQAEPFAVKRYLFEQVDIKTPIIFATAYDQYAIKAFKVNSVDYLLKPIEKEDARWR